ncbi:hypothetical protein C5167_030000 [Papaver somniferum]|nr:hypothetical protein C5167_030000 [Papaver somniferum]
MDLIDQEEWPEINHSDFEYGDNIPMISLSKVIKGKKDDVYRQTATTPDYGKNLPWAEIIQLLQSPQQVAGFATKVYGDQYHHKFSDAMLAYMEELDKLSMLIFEMLADGLGLPSDFFSKNFKEEKEATMIRVNRYRKCPLPEKCLGLGSHSDPHTLTILLQAHEVGGLQVLRPTDNQWVGIRPIPNSFVINIGDTLEAWTNGRLKSVVHRAVVNKERSRLSAAYFLSPSSQVMIDSPPQLIQPVSSNAKMYKPFTWGVESDEEIRRVPEMGSEERVHQYQVEEEEEENPVQTGFKHQQQ